MPLEIHLVSHTHWDREWYRTAEEFRLRLVDLVDELIAEPPADGQAFLLDGQAIVLEDYLEVRPARRDRLRSLLGTDRLEAGPWYVLADELIPGGESLVRNLLVGRHELASLGAVSPPVLYCPDSFGHPAALPELAVGFGLPLIILWRGYGGRRWPNGDTFRWKGPSGAEVIAFHLPPDGYEFGSSLPSDAQGAGARWKKIRDVLASRATTGVSLLQNGADHHARQHGQSAAIQALQAAAESSGDRLRPGSLRSFADALLDRARAQRLPSVSGELRDSYGYTWTLQGTFGTRSAQKRLNAIAERSLLTAEMWSAAAWLATGRSSVELTRAAWKSLLRAHPHDTLCGTSIDDVAAAMDVRLRAATLQAGALRERALQALIGHDASAARESGKPRQDIVVIENPLPAERGGVVLVEHVEKIADEPVGPGSGSGPRLEETSTDEPVVSKGMQLISSEITRNRIEGPRHYPDNDIVRTSTFACHVGPTRGLSLRPLRPFASEGVPKAKVRVSREAITNGDVTLAFAVNGELTARVAGREVQGLIRFEDRADRGDLYTPSIRDAASHPRFVRQRIVHRGPLLAELRQEWVLEAPGAKRGAIAATVQVSFRVVADSPLIEVHVAGDNRSDDHRLRIGIATGIADSRVVADAMFGAVERKPIVVADDDLAMERPPLTAPLHRYVSVFGGSDGVTVHSDGLGEYEVDDAGVVWVTMVRSVGQLSRNDLPERPGHAGWPADTPAAQARGPFESRLAFQAHGAPGIATSTAIEHASSAFLHPLRGWTLRESVATPETVGGIELSGDALRVSAIKESEDGTAIVVRCVNMSDREQRGAWTLWSPVADARLARLDETGAEPLAVIRDAGRSRIAFVAGPRAVVTILATRAG